MLILNQATVNSLGALIALFLIEPARLGKSPKSEITKEIRMTEISVWRKKRLSQQGCRRSRPAFKGQREIRIPLSLSNEQGTRNTPVQRDEPDRILPGQFNEVTIRDRLWLLHKRR